MGYESYRDLKVWREAKELAVWIYKISFEEPIAKDFALCNQIRKSAISISSNIAEGYERDSNKEFIRFLRIAKGSLAELETQLEIAHEIGYVGNNSLGSFQEKCQRIFPMLINLINYRKGLE